MSTPTQPVANETIIHPLSEFFIGRKKTNDRITRFRNGKYKLLSEAMKEKGYHQGESTYIWYPKEYFEMILDEMRLNNANGIRLYLGEYEGVPGKMPAGQIGVIFVLTERSDDGKIKDILLETKPEYAERIAKAEQIGITLNISSDPDSREFNVCGPCPPSCEDQVPTFPENEIEVTV